MSNIIQWAIVIVAVAISAVFLARKLKRQAKGKCDGCCDRCRLYSQASDCELSLHREKHEGNCQ